MCDCLKLETPDHHYIRPGNKVRLSRFDTECWQVGYGWIACNGNRPICAWYLVSESNPERTKLLSKPDLDDIYFIQQ